MAGFRQRLIALTKRQGQTFGFFLRVEQGEFGHLVRCLDMGGPAELAGMKDGDRILRVNGTFVDALSHLQVVELVKNSGVSVAFHVMDAESYKQAKAEGADLSQPRPAPAPAPAPAHAHAPTAGPARKPRLCHLVRTPAGFGFSLRSVQGEQGVFMTKVEPGGVAQQAGVQTDDRLLEVNGDGVEDATHEQVVEKIKGAGSSLVFLLVDEDTYRFYQNNHMKVGAGQATVTLLPLKPRIVDLAKGPEGYGYLLKEDPETRAHLITDIDGGSPAERAGLRDMDRLVAVDGLEVRDLPHRLVVDRIKESGATCCLLVVDQETEHLYKMAGVSPMLFWEETKSDGSPPSYTEALHLAAPREEHHKEEQPKEEEEEEQLKPRLCRMQKGADGYGFHINGVQGVNGQHIQQVVRGGVAEQAGLEDGDVLVEVNSVNVETRTHKEVVELVRKSGSSLELLVSSQRVYAELRARGVAVSAALLGPGSAGRVHTRATVEDRTRTQTPPPQRKPSVSSVSSEESMDIRF